MTKEIQIKSFFFTTHIVLTIAACFFSVQLFYKVVTAKFITVPKRSKVTVTSPQTRLSQDQNRPAKYPFSHYRVIVERNLFNTKANPEPKQKSKEIDTESLELTELKLKLWGTVMGATPDRSFAVIQETKGKRNQRQQSLYAIGDTIQGAVIKNILDEKVILNLNGKDQVLEMESMFASSGRSGSYSRRSSYRRSSSRSGRGVKQRITIQQNELDNALANANELMKQVRVSPHKEGFRISRIRSGSIFRKMGLRNGDVITSVDGTKVTDIQNGMRLYEQLKSGSGISLQVKRRGRYRDIVYSMK